MAVLITPRGSTADLHENIQSRRYHFRHLVRAPIDKTNKKNSFNDKQTVHSDAGRAYW